MLELVYLEKKDNKPREQPITQLANSNSLKHYYSFMVERPIEEMRS